MCQRLTQRSAPSSPDLVPHQLPNIRRHVKVDSCKNQTNVLVTGERGLSHKRTRAVNCRA